MTMHPNDKKLFDEHPAPLWEAWMEMHPAHINCTTPSYGPMMYWIMRAITGPNAVEIGVAQGYTSWFIAQGVKDNNTRFGCDGKYVAIDIGDKRPIFDPWIKDGLPMEFWQTDSLKVTHEMLNEAFPSGIDLIFQDGWHNTEHCMKELELYYPHLKGNGDGYLIMHDIYAYCEEYYKEVMKDPRWNFESVRFLNNYGLAICRKMDGYDHDKVFWPTGDQPDQDLDNPIL